jgi:hypothetical protein
MGALAVAKKVKLKRLPGLGAVLAYADARVEAEVDRGPKRFRELLRDGLTQLCERRFSRSQR